MKNSIVIFVMLVFICSCAAQKEVKKKGSLPPLVVSAGAVQPPTKPILPQKKPIKPLFGKLLKDVITSETSFNPSHGKKVRLSFSLTKPVKITINVYDPDLGLIKSETGKKFLGPGKQSFVWDGKDMDGNIVPDEAYFFTIIAEDKSGAKEIYDPTTFSGGVEHDITAASIDPQYHTINYVMPEMGRVMIRMGIQGGPLMNQLVDWKPRVKGAITEYWNGKDKDNLVDIYNDPKFKMIVSYFSLPANSVIAFGNKDYDFRVYKKSMAQNRPTKPKRTSSLQNVSYHYGLPRTMDYCPETRMSFTNVKGKDNNGIPILHGKTLVKVDLADKDKLVFQNQKFEICFFLDGEFYAEDEAGYIPFNWVWDLSNVGAGEHVFTVNLSGFKDQIGVLSRKVKVVK